MTRLAALNRGGLKSLLVLVWLSMEYGCIVASGFIGGTYSPFTATDCDQSKTFFVEKSPLLKGSMYDVWTRSPTARLLTTLK